MVKNLRIKFFSIFCLYKMFAHFCSSSALISQNFVAIEKVLWPSEHTHSHTTSLAFPKVEEEETSAEYAAYSVVLKVQ